MLNPILLEETETLSNVLERIRAAQGTPIKDLSLIELVTCERSGNGIYIFVANSESGQREYLYVGMAGSVSFAQRIAQHLDTREGEQSMMMSKLLQHVRDEWFTMEPLFRSCLDEVIRRKGVLILIPFLQGSRLGVFENRLIGDLIPAFNARKKPSRPEQLGMPVSIFVV
jgi:hypothetical protein